MVVPVRNVMRKEVVTAFGSETVHSAACRMVDGNRDCVVVCDNNKPVGILTHTDLVKRILCRKIETETEVKDVMTSPVTTADDLTPVVEVAKLMENKGIKRVPIVDSNSGELVGITSANDLVGAEADMITVLRSYLEATKADRAKKGC